MIETGKPFKMKPKTRKAENALRRAALAVGVPEDDVVWRRWRDPENKGPKQLVVADGDRHLVSMRWVKTQEDPDWEIVK